MKSWNITVYTTDGHMMIVSRSGKPEDICQELVDSGWEGQKSANGEEVFELQSVDEKVFVIR